MLSRLDFGFPRRSFYQLIYRSFCLSFCRSFGLSFYLSICLFICGATLVTPSTAVAVEERTVGQHVDDATLSTSVKYYLARADGVPFGSINVEVHKGYVQLSGFIHKRTQKEAALAAAATAQGATGVNDGLVLTEIPRTLGHFIDDQTIQAKLKTRIGETLGVTTAVAVVTHVRNGEVIVAGFVDSADERAAVVNTAQSISGVEKVYNRILLRDSR